MNQTFKTAFLPVLLCGLVMAHQSAPQPAGGQQPQPQATQPGTPQAAPRPGSSTPKSAAAPQRAISAKQKRSAAKKKSSKTAAQTEAAAPAPAPAPPATPPPAAPQLPPTLMNQPPVSPTVTLHNGLLTIDAPNSTLSEVLNGVRQATGALLEGPSPADRVAVRIGPGSPREVVAALLQGTQYDYLILASEHDPDSVTHILLTQASSSPEPTPPPQPPAMSPPPMPEPPEFLTPEPGSVQTGTVTEEQPPPPSPPTPPTQPQPVNPNQPWLTLPQQPAPQPQQRLQ